MALVESPSSSSTGTDTNSRHIKLDRKKKHNRPLKKLKLSLCVPCVSVIQVKTLLFVVFGSSCCFLVTLKQVGRKKHVVAILGNCLKKDQQEWTKESFLFLERRDLFVADNSFASRHTNAHIYTYLTHKNTSRKYLENPNSIVPHTHMCKVCYDICTHTSHFTFPVSLSIFHSAAVHSNNFSILFIWWFQLLTLKNKNMPILSKTQNQAEHWLGHSCSLPKKTAPYAITRLTHKHNPQEASYKTGLRCCVHSAKCGRGEHVCVEG